MISNHLKKDAYTLLIFTILVLTELISFGQVKAGHDIVVAADGSGDFRSISDV